MPLKPARAWARASSQPEASRASRRRALASLASCLFILHACRSPRLVGTVWCFCMWRAPAHQGARVHCAPATDHLTDHEFDKQEIGYLVAPDPRSSPHWLQCAPPHLAPHLAPRRAHTSAHEQHTAHTRTHTMPFYVEICASAGPGKVIVAWSDGHMTIKDAIRQLNDGEVDYKVLKGLPDKTNSTIVNAIVESNWSGDGRARLASLLPAQNWRAKFKLLQAIEGNMTGTYLKDIKVTSHPAPRT